MDDKLAERCLAIDKLDPTPRLIVSLYHYEGLNMGEISDVLNLDKSTVVTLLDRAMFRLKREFNVTI